MFKISIIIPCYNVSQYIDRCLNSIVSQTMSIDDLQIICIDDASTDDTWQHLQQWEKQYPNNIILIQCNQQIRQGAARNWGMRYVNTPYVSFIDADDWIEPDYYDIMYSYITGLDCEIVCCAYERDFSNALTYFENRNTTGQSRYLIIDTPKKREVFLHAKSMGYSSCCKLIQTGFLLNNQIYFPEGLAYEDNFWSSLLHLYAENVFILEEKLYHYFVNPSSTIMKEDTDYHADYITIYLLLWDEWEKRGFYPYYKDALEYDYLYSFYFCFLRILIIRFSKPQFSLFLLLKQLFLERVPDYRFNPYIDEHFDDFHKLMLQPLLSPITKNDFMIFAKNTKIYWMIEAKKESTK